MCLYLLTGPSWWLFSIKTQSMATFFSPRAWCRSSTGPPRNQSIGHWLSPCDGLNMPISNDMLQNLVVETRGTKETHPKIPDTKYRFLSERFPQCLCKTVPFDAVHLDKDDIEGPVGYPIAHNRRYTKKYWEIAVHWPNGYLALVPSLSINPFLTISSNVLLLKVTLRSSY